MSKRLPAKLRAYILAKAKHRCGYCLAPEVCLYQTLRIDHVIPLSEGGSSDEDNLWASCDSCNGHKSNKTKGIDPQTNSLVDLFNPITQIWSEHFAFGEDKATIIGITPTGRATVAVLKMNEDHMLIVRRDWITLKKYPPED